MKYLDVLLNCILVDEGVRSAMLVQPVDYGEAYGHDPITRSILDWITETFPDLKHSENYSTYQGVIISKTDYNGKTISPNRMGEILSYPCYKGFEEIDRNDTHYSISIYAIRADNHRIPLFANVCKDEEMISQFNDIAIRAKEVLGWPKYREILKGVEIVDVIVSSTPIIPTVKIIQKLIKYDAHSIEYDDMLQINEIITNFNFSNLLIYKFQFNNPVHRGILLGLMAKDRFNPIRAFYPLQYHPEKKLVYRYTKQLENELITILDATRI